MAMMNLSKLQIRTKWLCRLRLACRRLNFVVERKLLSHVVIDVVAKPSVAVNQITALVRRQTAACEHAQTLCIRSIGKQCISPEKWLDPTVFVWNDLREFLGLAIANMKNVETITWWVLYNYIIAFVGSINKLSRNTVGEQRWLIESIWHSIASLPSLSNVTLDFNTEEPPDLHLLRGLKKLSVAGGYFVMQRALPKIAGAIGHSPELEHLEVRVIEARDDIKYKGDLFSELDCSATLKLQHVGFIDCFSSLQPTSLPHLRSLTSFHWIVPPDRYSYRQRTTSQSVWQMFMQENITLSELLTSELDDDLMQYLRSFEGLRKLEINVARRDQWSFRLSDTFYDLVLPKHTHSLEVLGTLVGSVLVRVKLD
jgi:hypothetical protein